MTEVSQPNSVGAGAAMWLLPSYLLGWNLQLGGDEIPQTHATGECGESRQQPSAPKALGSTTYQVATTVGSFEE